MKILFSLTILAIFCSCSFADSGLEELQEVCDVPRNILTVVTGCIESSLRADSKREFDEILECANLSSLMDVIDVVCSGNQSKMQQLDTCSEGASSGELDFDEDQADRCVQRRLG